MRAIHRLTAIFALLFTFYLGCTGTLIQLTDLRTLFGHVSAFDPNLRSIREGFSGPGNYQLIATADYVAHSIPDGADLDAMLATTLRGARATLGTAPLSFVELRMVDGRPVGQVKFGTAVLRFDAVSGASLGQAAPGLKDEGSPISLRNTLKNFHRMTVFGNWALWINPTVSIALATLIVTGLVVYGKLLLARARIDRKGLFWFAGGWWKTLHRAISIVAAAWLVVVILSGAWLAMESLSIYLYSVVHHSTGQSDNASSPVNDAALPTMLHTTLAAYHAAMPGTSLRVVRLRIYAGMPQGAVISGGEVAQQFVWNAVTGQRVGDTEPGYPPTGFPFGWHAHQVAKSVHRGDFFGLPGRFLDLFAGLSVIYLSVSGFVMYYELWNKRRRNGRPGLIWR